MKRLESRKSHSWWWDSHISPKNSKWLAENLEEMDRSVKRMLKLIEEEGDSFAKKAEMYYQKRPELISHVEEFYRMYRSLAERYDHLTGELRKNIPSDLQSQGSGISDCGSDSSSSLPILERKPSRRRSSHRAAGFDFFLGSGVGSSDLSRKESDESSSSSSDSESESDAASSKNNYSGPPENGDGVGMSRRIIELEVELREVREKLQVAEEENSDALSKVAENGKYEELHGRISWYEEELKVANERLRLSEEEVAKLKLEIANTESEHTHYLRVQLESAQKDIEMKDAELNFEKSRVSELQERIAGLEAIVRDTDNKIQQVEKELRITNKKLEVSDEEIVSLKLELEKKESSEATRGLQVQLASDPEDIVNEMARIESNNGLIAGLEADILDRDRRIEALEEELRIRKEKLWLSEEEIVRLKLEFEKNKASIINAVDLQFELESARKDIEEREAECKSERRRVSELQEWIMRLEIDLSDRDHEIRGLKIAIIDVDRNFSSEKSQLQTVISGLSQSLALLESKLSEWESKGRTLEEEIKRVEIENTELRDLKVTREMGMQSEIELLKADIAERSNRVEELNKSIDALKLKYDMLVAERDGLNAEVLRLIAEVGSRDDRINQMDGHLHRLHMEHVELISRSEGARKVVEELGTRVKELEEEVERQRVVILDGAEEKREAIRQLCFSLEHYRNGYHQLRQAFLVHKRPALLVS